MAGQRLKWWTLIAACFALFMAILDNLVVNIALPTISRELNATTTQLQWIVSAYTLIFASLQITAGGLGDRLGRKRWFLFGLGLFTVASLFGALSQNITMLIAARAMQGLGAAFIMPLSLSLISVAFPPEERGKALGIWSAISVSGLALGPIVGGFLVQYANWHWVFIINIPIGIVAFFVASAVVQESRDTSGTVALDIPGTALITGAIASLTWGLIEAGDRGWGDTLILAAFAAAAVLTAAFICGRGAHREADGAAALLPLVHLLRREHGRLRRLVPDRRRRLLHDALPAEHPRLLARAGGAGDAADGHHDDGLLADLRDTDRSHRLAPADHARHEHRRVSARCSSCAAASTPPTWRSSPPSS